MVNRFGFEVDDRRTSKPYLPTGADVRMDPAAGVAAYTEFTVASYFRSGSCQLAEVGW